MTAEHTRTVFSRRRRKPTTQLCRGERDGVRCTASIELHYWAKVRASDKGWFFQKDGTIWCPEHVPEWVPAWRAEKKRKVDLLQSVDCPRCKAQVGEPCLGPNGNKMQDWSRYHLPRGRKVGLWT